MNREITSFTGKLFQEILDKNINICTYSLSDDFLKFLSGGIVKTGNNFCFGALQDIFENAPKQDDNESMYFEYIQNKKYLSDFFLKKPSLQTMVILGKFMVDAFVINAQERYPNNNLVIFCMINKQRLSDVWISIYEYKENSEPLLEPYSDTTQFNSYYLRRSGN